MPEPSDRERGINAYAAEVRSFQRFFSIVLFTIVALHLLVLRPLIQVRTAMPVLAGRIAEVERQVAATEGADRTAAASAAALAQFRRAMETGPEDLRRTIGTLVARGRDAAGPGGDPYKATIRAPRDVTQTSSGSPAEETILVEEAIRAQIGRQVEALSMALDAALDPLRTMKTPSPEIQEALRVAQEDLGRNVLALNEVLRAAFAGDPEFWRKLSGPGASFGAASSRALEVTRRINEALRTLDSQLTSPSGTKNRQAVLQARITTLEGRRGELRDRLTGLNARLAWIPLSPEEWMRLYPILVGALALTVLFRLRRILNYRRALSGVDLDLLAPSWIVGSPGAPGRWWALLLMALPLLAAMYAAYSVMVDPGLFTSILGDPSPVMMVGFWAAYLALVGVGIVQLLTVARALAVTQPKRPQGQAGRGTGG